MRSRLAPHATAALIALAAPLAGCTFGAPPPPSAQQRAERRIMQDCRAEADRIYEVQNRELMSVRSTTDTPYSSNGMPSAPSQGLSGRYAYDQLLEACLRNNLGGQAPVPAAQGPGPGPAKGNP
jgi:hypothetical protein